MAQRDGYTSGQPQAQQVEANESNVYALCYSFNQENSSFVCGTTAGFRVYTTTPLCEVKRRESTDKTKANALPGQVGLVRMLFRTQIFPMAMVDPVTGDGPLKIKIWDEGKRQFIAELRSKHEVKGVAIQREVIAMVCEHAVYIYRADNCKILLHLTTARNERGLCALASAAKPWVLACPGQTIGSIKVQIGEDDSGSCVIEEAHKSGLAGLALNSSGTLIASASDYGTVVKVFARNGDLLHALRRSIRPTTISCLTFREDDRFLAVGCSSGTVHIFRIDIEQCPTERIEFEQEDEDEGGSNFGVGEMVLGALAGLASEPKSFARFRIPEEDSADIRSPCSTIFGPQVCFRGAEPTLLVLHHNGVFYEAGFSDVVEAGSSVQECSCKDATTWFAVRPDFKMLTPSVVVPTVKGGTTEEDEEAEDWQLL